MRKLLIVLLILSCVSAYEIEGLVSDYAGVLGADSQQIESMLANIKQDGKAEFAVVTIPGLEGRDIEGYAFELAEGVLGDEELNNGLLLLIAVDDHRYRFEVGRGLEADLPDILVSRIGEDYLVPNFRNNDYGRGVREAVGAIDSVLEGKELPAPEAQWTDFAVIALIILAFFGFWAFMVFSFIAMFIYAYRRGKKHKDDGKIMLAILAFGAWQNSSSGGGHHGRGGGSWGGGSSGGGGSFGGGSFGGGGSSGGW